MTYVLWAGSALGAVIGLLHAFYLYRQGAASRMASGATQPAVTRGEAVYRALWAFVLWTAFGSYVLVLWIAGAVLYSVWRLVPKRSMT